MNQAGVHFFKTMKNTGQRGIEVQKRADQRQRMDVGAGGRTFEQTGTCGFSKEKEEQREKTSQSKAAQADSDSDIMNSFFVSKCMKLRY